VQAASQEYFADEDILGQWLTANCECNPGFATPTARLYANWTAFAEAAGIAPGSQKRLGEALRSRGFQADRTRSGRLWRGLRLRGGGDE
jgi:putative DNA primase/helicase